MELRTDLLGCGLILLQVGNVVVKVNAVLLQKGVHFHPGLEAQHLAQRGFGKPFCAIAFEGQGLKSYARWVRTFWSHSTGKLIRNIERDPHGLRIAYRVVW